MLLSYSVSFALLVSLVTCSFDFALSNDVICVKGFHPDGDIGVASKDDENCYVLHQKQDVENSITSDQQLKVNYISPGIIGIAEDCNNGFFDGQAPPPNHKEVCLAKKKQKEDAANSQPPITPTNPHVRPTRKDIPELVVDSTGFHDNTAYGEHKLYKRSNRAAISKLKHTRARNSIHHKRNRIRAVPASYIQTTTVEAIDFIPENLHLNRRQVLSKEVGNQSFPFELFLGLLIGFGVLLFLLVYYFYKRESKNLEKRMALYQAEDLSNGVSPCSVQKPEPVLDSDHNVQTKWRMKGFLGVVSSVVAKLPKNRSMASSVDHMPAPVSSQQRQY